MESLDTKFTARNQNDLYGKITDCLNLLRFYNVYVILISCYSDYYSSCFPDEGATTRNLAHWLETFSALFRHQCVLLRVTFLTALSKRNQTTRYSEELS